MKKRVFGIILIILGIIVLFNYYITGAAISTTIGSKASFVLGLALFIGGGMLVLQAGRKYCPDMREYYRTRTKELTRYAGTDEWIARWELEGIQRTLREGGVRIRPPERHYGGVTGPEIEHINLEGVYDSGERYKKEEKKVELSKKHIFIASDPNDRRLFYTPKGEKPKGEKPKKRERTIKRVFRESPIKRAKLFKKSNYNPKYCLCS